jgi:farnesyl-diphosphate farnesyltransferase
MPELNKEILVGVSRSFYVTLKLLPAAVRGPLSLGYLLARAADTVADTDALPAQERLACLKRFEQRVCDHAADPNLTPDLCALLTDKLDHPEERLLLERLDECLKWLDDSPADEREAIEKVLRVILKGQRLDVERFELNEGASALPDAEALDEYTYLVAGCVGEFWTTVPAQKLGDGFARADLPTMLELGIRYGKGLQLVNVIRDFPKDLRERGRCYWPLTELRAAGFSESGRLESLLESPELIAQVSKPWRKLCREHLDQGMRYVRLVKNRRHRLATALPMFLGYRTLDAIEAADWETYVAGIKVNRRAVRRELLRSMRVALFG